MSKGKFLLSANQIKDLISNIGGCYASNKITIEGFKVKYMYREPSNFENDSGWRFFSGKETQEYVDNPDNLMIFDVNTIANYDPSIIPYLEMPVGTELERGAGNFFVVVN